MTDYSKLEWMPLYVMDWLTSPAILSMSAEQEGAYIRLLMFAWGDGDVEPSLPSDPQSLARLSRLGGRWKSQGPLVRSQFVEREPADGRIINLRQVDVWERQQRLHGVYVARAALGGRATALRRKQGHLKRTPSTTPSTTSAPPEALPQAPLEASLELPPELVQSKAAWRVQSVKELQRTTTATTTTPSSSSGTDVSGEPFDSPPAIRLAARIPDLADRAALAAVLRVAPAPAVWALEMLASLDGMGGHVPVSPEQLGTALRDYLGNGASTAPNMAHFRSYLRRSANAPHPGLARLADDPVLRAFDQMQRDEDDRIAREGE